MKLKEKFEELLGFGVWGLGFGVWGLGSIISCSKEGISIKIKGRGRNDRRGKKAKKLKI